MENALDFNSRKDKFLTRLALDPRALAIPSSAYNGDVISSEWNDDYSFGYRPNHNIQCSNHPLNNETITIGYGENGSPSTPTPRAPSNQAIDDDNPSPPFTSDHVGTYYGSSDPSQLKGIFAQVAKQILLELSL